MKPILGLMLLAALAGCSDKHAGHPSADTSHQHGGPDHKGDPHAAHHAAADGAMMMVRTEPAQPKAGDKIVLKLMIHDAAGAMLKDFEVVHEHKVHLIVVRDGLDQFAHLHPEIDAAGNMTVTHTFPVGGTYWLCADYKPVGRPAGVARTEVSVSGVAPEKPAIVPNAANQIQADGLQAAVKIVGAKAGADGRVEFTLTDTANKPLTDLQPYMGAMGHLVVISADGKDYVHSHPAPGKTAANVIAFDVHFGKAGIYKGWGQFLRAGTVRIVPFAFQVD
jgi:hypothetical protein